MKLGIISDIHGNLQALEAVLKALKLETVDLILCAGDLVCYGANPNEVIEVLQVEKIPCVTGNYDYACAFNLSKVSRGSSSPESEDIKQTALQWTKENLTSSSQHFLQTLPWRSNFVFEGVRVALFHAGLEHLDENYFPQDSEGFQYLANRVNSDVVVFGHTHMAFTKHTASTLFVNPGAVGRSLDGDVRAAYGLLELPSKQLELKRISYNLDEAVSAIRGSRMPSIIADLIQRGAKRTEELEHVKS
jgi:putative phosphoesterase